MDFIMHAQKKAQAGTAFNVIYSIIFFAVKGRKDNWRTYTKFTAGIQPQEVKHDQGII